MTKNLLCLAFLFFGISLAAQTTPIPDANFEKFLVDQGIDTNGLNGNILDVDAQAITDLNISTNDITNFTGLEAFVNLLTLNLGLNDFITVPLTTLTSLEELVFDDNDVLAGLDLTQNTNLRILNIGATGNGGTPPIPSLDISQNTLLEDIYIYAFTSLADIILPQTATLKNIKIIASAEDVFDFTNHSGLEELWLNQNTSTTNITLPASKTTLTKLDIRNQRVSSVDLSGFNTLEDVNLGGTEVETLLLPTSTVLRRLTITRHKLPSVFSFASVPNLEILYVTSNLLTTAFDVDITSNTLLDDLDLSSNKMENLNMTQNTLLTEVNVSRNALVTFDTSQNTLLEDLNASTNNITSLDLSQNVALENLNLNTNELPTIDLTTNIELENLNLGTNQIPTLDITTNTKITNLRIDNNLFTTTGLDLTQNVDLRNLNAERNQIESLDITQNLDLNTIILNYNLFPGTAILDQFYAIRAGDDGIRSGTLEVSHNLLTGSIPNFTDLMHLGPGNDWTRYFELTIDNNYFEFGDIEGEHQDLVAMLTTRGSFNIPVMRTYDYAPQAKVNAIENLTPNAGTSITLITNVRGAENHYQWFKDGVPIADATDSPEYTITDLNTCDAGVYHSEITSDLVPFENASPPGTNGKNLLLVRNDITLTVNATKACVTLANPVNGASNVPINTGIEWNDNPGACGYKISVGTSSGATDIVNNEDVGEVSIYNFTTDLPPNQEIFVTIIPYFDDGDFAGCTEESFTTNTSAVAPECTTLNSPENDDTNVAADIPSISWNPAFGADTYQIEITSTSGRNNLVMTNVGNTLTHNLSEDFQSGDVVTVQIIPSNSVGDAVGPCSTESFTIVSASPTVPSSCSDLASPLAGAANVATDIGSISWDPVADATEYRISINGSISNINDITNQNITTSSHTLPGDFDNGETVSVTITPFNTTGDAIGCDTPQTFTIVATTPTVPSSCSDLASPSAGDSDVATNIGSISWNAVADATGYRVTINGSTSNINDITNQDITGTSFTLPGDFDNGETVSVTIIPFNTTGDAIGCDTPQNFTIVAATPTVPNSCSDLASPSAGDSDVATNIGSISWDAVANATGYRVSINGSTSNINDITNQDITGTSFTLPGDFDDGETVSVTIIPFNTTGDAVGCDTPQTFTIVAAIPTVPSSCSDLASPSAGDSDVATNIGSISWNAVADATGYRVTINGSTSNINDITNQDITGTSFTLPGDFDDGETVSVTIIPFNTTGDAVGCDTSQTFTIRTSAENSIPPCTELITELNGASDVVVTTSIAWNAVNNADGYFLSLRTEAGETIVQETDLGILTSYSLSEDLPFETTIIVTITPYNSAGSSVSCTESSFTTSAEPEEPIIEDDTKYGFSPDGDGINEYWYIDNIEYYPENLVMIYNRWGDAVFQINNYDNNSNVFRGEANLKTKMGAGKLPAGTYFFHIQIEGETILKKTTGYVVIKR
ncbi:gliding motility-associated C-terminal domain-containing protein [uncultured Zobellia sp.]|uniref:T9SS type B sorting domain-containing protein n=1 Tax=uncultured Zobellia sp. TaxID=255433 RepID=UPI0025964280|nr:gliding motility-associated C-terminal domain-containing protein [uncultured Zobellia sp.]